MAWNILVSPERTMFCFCLKSKDFDLLSIPHDSRAMIRGGVDPITVDVGAEFGAMASVLKARGGNTPAVVISDR